MEAARLVGRSAPLQGCQAVSDHCFYVRPRTPLQPAHATPTAGRFGGPRTASRRYVAAMCTRSSRSRSTPTRAWLTSSAQSGGPCQRSSYARATRAGTSDGTRQVVGFISSAAADSSGRGRWAVAGVVPGRRCFGDVGDSANAFGQYGSPSRHPKPVTITRGSRRCAGRDVSGRSWRWSLPARWRKGR